MQGSAQPLHAQGTITFSQVWDKDSGGRTTEGGERLLVRISLLRQYDCKARDRSARNMPMRRTSCCATYSIPGQTSCHAMQESCCFEDMYVTPEILALMIVRCFHLGLASPHVHISYSTQDDKHPHLCGDPMHTTHACIHICAPPKHAGMPRTRPSSQNPCWRCHFSSQPG